MWSPHNNVMINRNGIVVNNWAGELNLAVVSVVSHAVINILSFFFSQKKSTKRSMATVDNDQHDLLDVFIPSIFHKKTLDCTFYGCSIVLLLHSFHCNSV